MAGHNLLGMQGEDFAADFLEQKGYTILHRNWHFRHKEIDIVAQQGDFLVMVEVKTRRNDEFGTPVEAINNAKIRRLVSAADAYVKRFAYDGKVRFDVLSLTQQGDTFHVEHIEDAFYPPLN